MVASSLFGNSIGNSSVVNSVLLKRHPALDEFVVWEFHGLLAEFVISE